jgi:septin family protein
MKAVRLGLTLVALIVFMGAADAESAEGGPPTAPPPAKAAAQAQAQESPAPKAAPAPAPSSVAIPDRVSALEKQNLVLTEDIGKARLETRTRLEALAKQQAEQIQKLNQELAQQRAQMEADRKKQQERNRNVWIAVGVLALGVIAAN